MVSGMEKGRSKIDYVIIVIAPVLLIILWQEACKNSWVNGSIVPSPERVIEAYVSLWNNHMLQEHLWASTYRVIIGFLSGAGAGIVLGIITGIFIKADDVLSVVFSVLRSIPTIGLVPLLILWYGIGEESKVIVIAIGTFWSVLLNTQHGISGTDKKLLEVAQLLEKNKITVLTKIIFPAALPSIFTGIRLGISSAWKSVVAAEMIASVRGIGYMISYAREMIQPDVMFVGLITLGVIGLFLDVVVLKIQKLLIRWE